MPITVKHVFTSPIADGTDTQLVRPSDWNSSHLMTLDLAGSEVFGAFSNGGNVTFGLNTAGFITANAPTGGGGLTNINVSAGTTSNNLSNFIFADGNGISFGLNGSTITASHNGLTTAARSDQVVNSLNGSTGQISLNVGSSLSASTNGSSITFGLASNITTALQSAGNYLTTAAQSNQVVNSLNGSTGQISLNVGSSLSASTNGSSITFGLASNITTALQSTGNYLTTARASNDAIGLNSAFTAGPLAMTINSSGLSLNAGSAAGTTSGFAGNLISGSMTHNTAGLNISLNHPAWLTTARASNDAVGLNSAFTAGPLAMTINSSGLSLNAGSAAGTTSGFAGNLISGSMTHNTAGLNLSLNHPAWLTTARASNDAIGLNTAQSNVTWTVNSSGLSLDARGYAGTGFTGTNASATFNSNGLQLSVAGGGVINQTGPNISAGSDSLFTSGTVTFGNAFGISFVTSNGSVVASNAFLTTAMASNGGSDFIAATAAFNGTNISGTLASNGISLSVAAPGGGGGVESHWNNTPFIWSAAVVPPSSMRQSTSLAFPAVIPYDLSMGQMRMLRSVVAGTTQVATVANTSWGFTQNETHNYVFYTQGTGASSLSLRSYTSTSVGLSMTVQGSVGAASNNLSVWHSINVPYAGGTSQFTASTAPAGSASLPFNSTHLSNFISGLRLWDSQMGMSLPGNEYWVLHGISSAGTTGGATAASALTAATLGMNAIGWPNINSNIASFGTSAQSFNQVYANLGGSFTTAGGGSTASLNITQISSWASHFVPFVWLDRIA